MSITLLLFFPTESFSSQTLSVLLDWLEMIPPKHLIVKLWVKIFYLFLVEFG